MQDPVKSIRRIWSDSAQYQSPYPPPSYQQDRNYSDMNPIDAELYSNDMPISNDLRSSFRDRCISKITSFRTTSNRFLSNLSQSRLSSSTTNDESQSLAVSSLSGLKAPNSYVHSRADDIWNVVRASSIEYNAATIENKQNSPFQSTIEHSMASMGNPNGCLNVQNNSEFILHDMFACHVRPCRRSREQIYPYRLTSGGYNDATANKNVSKSTNTPHSKRNSQPDSTKRKKSRNKRHKSDFNLAESIVPPNQGQGSTKERFSENRRILRKRKKQLHHSSSTVSSKSFGRRRDMDRTDSVSSRVKRQNRFSVGCFAPGSPKVKLPKAGKRNASTIDMDSLSPYDSNGHVVDFQRIHAARDQHNFSNFTTSSQLNDRGRVDHSNLVDSDMSTFTNLGKSFGVQGESIATKFDTREENKESKQISANKNIVPSSPSRLTDGPEEVVSIESGPLSSWIEEVVWEVETNSGARD